MTNKDKQQLIKEIEKMRLVKTTGYGYSRVFGIKYPKNQREHHQYGISGDGFNQAIDKVIELIKETNPSK